MYDLRAFWGPIQVMGKCILKWPQWLWKAQGSSLVPSWNYANSQSWRKLVMVQCWKAGAYQSWPECLINLLWEISWSCTYIRPGTKPLSRNWSVWFFKTILYHFQTLKLFPFYWTLGLLVGRSNAVLKCTYFKINCSLTSVSKTWLESFFLWQKLF